MSQEHERVAEQAEDRCENYAMLSRLFRCEIGADLLADLIDSPVAEPTGNRRFDEGYARLRAHLDAVEDVAKGKSVLAIDYCLAFLGYGVDPCKVDEMGANAAYPYESVYGSRSGKSLGGEHCAEVSATFRAHSFMPDKERLIAEDHMACELEFMQYLTGAELASLREDDASGASDARKAQLTFLESHLLQWVEPFQKAVERFAETEFYRGLLEMTRGWLELDEAHLRALCAEGGE